MRKLERERWESSWLICEFEEGIARSHREVAYINYKDRHATQEFDDEDNDDVATTRSNRRGAAPARPVETPETRRKKLMNSIQKAAGGELMT